MAQQASKLPSGENLSKPMVAYHQAVEGRITGLQSRVDQVEEGAVTIDGATGDFTLGYGLSRSGQALSAGLSTTLTAALGSDVAVNNTGLYFDGPSIAQGTTGTWLVTGTVQLSNTASASTCNIKLWDGTTVVASARCFIPGTNSAINVTLSGIVTNPAGNLRISVNDPGTTTSVIKFNHSGNSKDSHIAAVRIA